MQNTYSLVTNGIKIEVITSYHEAFSNPVLKQFAYLYTIRIENLTRSSIQLVSRHWNITNGCSELKQITGAGVIGLLPVIAAGQAFEYQSYCLIETPTGTMNGHFNFINLTDNTELQAEIPAFALVFPYLLN